MKQSFFAFPLYAEGLLFKAAKTMQFSHVPSVRGGITVDDAGLRVVLLCSLCTRRDYCLSNNFFLNTI